MALINCDECGNQVSDKASVCPKCGAPIIQRIICPECKSRVSAKSIVCSECGAPLPLAVECPECKAYISKHDKVCPHCGCPCSTQVQGYTTPQYQPPVSERWAVQPTTEELNYMAREEINRFNWGAFFMWPLWGFANGMFYLFFVNFAFQILYFLLIYGNEVGQIFFGIIGFVINLVFGINGSKWAWHNKKWRDLEHFRDVQRSWKYWAVGLLIVLVIFFLIAFIIILTTA